ncbi:M48 family metalloprotease [Rhizobium laguerreae]|uniref:M48 family metalloprotease n=1 Tax=Rhizobium laguerreae TaxID=1076926 RepID=UPI0014793AB7|nr:M48 family metalloprotease [Rhizobium laguerreae]NNH85791.1 M48 family metalloprotease [Rhizobium laguerreae]
MAQKAFNPNALPSATNVRFVLLAATVTLMALWYGNEVLEGLRFLNTFNQPLNFGASAMIVICVWLLAVGVYLAHPLFCKSRFTRKVVVAPEELQAEIASAVGNIGLRYVKVLLDDNIRNFDAIAYGYPFRRKVLLGKGNLIQFRKQPDVFRAKLHHEMSHIRNHDVDTGFLAIGLLFAAATLVAAVVVYWAANFIGFTFLYYRGEAYVIHDPWYFVLTDGIPLLAVGAMWIAALWLEHRSFIRAREFMADAEAAHCCQVASVQAALGQGGAVAGKVDFLERLRGLARAHPTTVQRAAAVVEYRGAGIPTPGLFFTVGYLFSIVDSLIEVLRGKYATDDSVDAWSCDGAGCLTNLAGIIASDNAYFFVTGVGLFLIDAFIILSIATLLRGALQAKLTQQTLSRYCFACLKIAIAYGIGYVIGNVIDPFYFKSLLESGFSGWVPSYPQGALNNALRFGIFLFFVAILAYGLAGYFLSGTRKKRVSETQWILFCGFAILAVSQLFTGAWVVLTLLDVIQDPVDNDERFTIIAGAFGGFALWALLAAAVGHSIRRGFFRRLDSDTVVGARGS